MNEDLVERQRRALFTAEGYRNLVAIELEAATRIEELLVRLDAAITLPQKETP